MKHPLDRMKTGSDTGLERAIGMKKDALPRKTTLDLQKRPRTHQPGRRAGEFVRIARQEETPVWER